MPGGSPPVAALRVPPPPDRRVNDYAGALSAAEREALERKLVAAEGTSRNQVVVAVFRSLEGESLEDYSIRLAQAWRVGQKGLDNGVIFLVFVEDRRMRLEVGYGLEPTLTDAIASSILRDVVAGHFRGGRLADGIGAGVDAILRAIAGEYRQPAGGARRDQEVPASQLALLALIVLVIGVAVIAQARAAARARRRGWTGGSRGWGPGAYPPVIILPPPGRYGPGDPGGDVDDDRFSGSCGGFGGGGGRFGGGGASGSW